MNLFDRYRARRATDEESPPVQPLLPAVERPRPVVDTIQPIKIDMSQYLQLTRALRPNDSLLEEEKEMLQDEEEAVEPTFSKIQELSEETRRSTEGDSARWDRSQNTPIV